MNESMLCTEVQMVGQNYNDGYAEKNSFEETVRNYIANVLMPQLKQGGMVYKILDCLTSSVDTRMLQSMYTLASEFGVNAKISMENDESSYSFWLGNDD